MTASVGAPGVCYDRACPHSFDRMETPMTCTDVLHDQTMDGVGIAIE
jgi:hypothetical protein